MQGQIVDVPVVQELAKKYNKTPAQIALRWNLQHEVVTIPKSVRPSRIAENAQIFDFELSQEDMGLLDALDRRTSVWGLIPIISIFKPNHLRLRHGQETET